jgi:hypothetical protein
MPKKICKIAGIRHPWPVRASIRKRVLLVALLFCKLVTAQFAFESMAVAANSSPVSETSMSAHPCPEHEGKSGEQTSDEDSKNSGSCKTGACKCPCAHTPALAMSVLIPSSRVAENSAPAFHSDPSPPGSNTLFFRPPISLIV